MARRPLDEIIEEIVFYLRPLKPQAVNRLPAIKHAIKHAVEEIAKDDLAYLRNAKKICKRAREADIALAKLERLFPPSKDSKIHRFRLWLQALARTKGPDPRTNTIQWECARHAFVLVNEFSEKPPVKLQNGNCHLIAQLLFEAVTGKPPSEAGLLRAVKRVARFLKN
jgi:hypothetical protein